jgi:hypothetical protein
MVVVRRKFRSRVGMRGVPIDSAPGNDARQARTGRQGLAHRVGVSLESRLQPVLAKTA